MFNRQPFNRTVQDSIGASGIALMGVSAIATLNKDIFYKSNIANLKLGGILNLTNNKFMSSLVDIAINTNANATKVFLLSSDIANVVFEVQANQLISGESIISLSGLVLAPGQELIINTSDMTVTLNGMNGMEYFTVDSDFFSLLSGANTIIYTDSNSSRSANVDIIWKDRWL